MSTRKPIEKSAAAKLEEAIAYIHKARIDNAKLQGQYAPGSAAWHQCETIDDHLHEALTLLGD